MTLILGSGGLSGLAASRARLEALRRRGHWPAQVPTVVLVETLTGDHRKDFGVNRLLRTCQLRGIDEHLARGAARLRAATGRAAEISVTDAVVAALAERIPHSIVLTSDVKDLRALAAVAERRFHVATL
jgi:hypothetical protein